MNRQTKIMMAQFKKATQEPNEFIKFVLKSEKEVNVWYILLSGFTGDNNEFVGGEYLCRMEAPVDFPFKPPSFYMLTENGVYGVEKKVCINIGEYHADQYRAALGMAGFASQLISGLVGWRDLGGGIEIHTTSLEVKKKNARESRAENIKRYPQIMDMINQSYNDYSSRWDLTKIPEPLKIKLGLIRGPQTGFSSAAICDLDIKFGGLTVQSPDN